MNFHKFENTFCVCSHDVVDGSAVEGAITFTYTMDTFVAVRPIPRATSSHRITTANNDQWDNHRNKLQRFHNQFPKQIYLCFPTYKSHSTCYCLSPRVTIPTAFLYAPTGGQQTIIMNILKDVLRLSLSVFPLYP